MESIYFSSVSHVPSIRRVIVMMRRKPLRPALRALTADCDAGSSPCCRFHKIAGGNSSPVACSILRVLHRIEERAQARAISFVWRSLRMKIPLFLHDQMFFSVMTIGVCTLEVAEMAPPDRQCCAWPTSALAGTPNVFVQQPVLSEQSARPAVPGRQGGWQQPTAGPASTHHLLS
ncbi:MAG: hypothetical protein OXC07_01650 [Kistimonas sp.]|nr:hypothetical protein [Kistimonas sp.]